MNEMEFLMIFYELMNNRRNKLSWPTFSNTTLHPRRSLKQKIHSTHALGNIILNILVPIEPYFYGELLTSDAIKFSFTTYSQIAAPSNSSLGLSEVNSARF
jgi:hypothetical protein